MNMLDMNVNSQPAPIRSFARREGRLTEGQQRALDTLWEQFGYIPERSQTIDLDRLFGRNAQRIVEIGFGNGEALVTLARQQPKIDFLGIEVYRPGIGHLLLQLAAFDLPNVRIIADDAKKVFSDYLPPSSVDRIHIFFPDPWPKKRHQKRRLIQPDFVARLATILKVGGTLHLATDWPDYALWMLNVLQACEQLTNQSDRGFIARPEFRPMTKFEQRGYREGRVSWDLLFVRK